MRLLFDLDGTLAHFDLRFDEYLDADYPHFPDIPRSGNQLSFNLWDGRTVDEQEAIREIMNRPGFYKGLKPVAGGVEAVKEAESMGHEVLFVSAPWTTNPTCASDKYEWVEEVFGEGWANKLILAKDKTVVSGDILFDDKDPIPHRENADWVQVFYTQPYNTNAPGYRVSSWESDEWKHVIKEVDQKRRMEFLPDFKFVGI